MTTQSSACPRIRRRVIIVVLTLVAAGSFSDVTSAAPYPPVPPTVAVSSGVPVPGAGAQAPGAAPGSGQAVTAPGEWPVQAPTGGYDPGADGTSTGWTVTAIGLVAVLGGLLLVRFVRRS